MGWIMGRLSDHPMMPDQRAAWASFPKEREYDSLPSQASPRPTYHEMLAIWFAYFRVVNESPAGGGGSAYVRVDGSNPPLRALVMRYADQSYTASIVADDDRGENGLRYVKEWRGIPQWPQRGEAMTRRIIDRREHYDVLHGDVYHHHQLPDEHIDARQQRDRGWLSGWRGDSEARELPSPDAPRMLPPPQRAIVPSQQFELQRHVYAGGSRIKPARNGHHYLNATRNGRPMTLMFDSGCSGLSLKQSTARSIGLDFRTARYDFPVHAERIVYHWRLDLIEIIVEGIPVRNVATTVSKDDSGADVIGEQVLRHYCTIMFDRGDLVLQA